MHLPNTETQKAPISVLAACIITFNEAHRIERCINALRGLVHEIIVVDSHSTDDTRERAAALGARVFTNPWPGYAAQKNVAAAHATCPYILSVDADEELTPALAAAIRHAFADVHTPDLPLYFKLKREMVYCGKRIRYGGLTHDTVLRIYPRTAQWQGTIHEAIAAPPNTVMPTLKGLLLHYSYDSVAEHARQALAFGIAAGEAKRARGKRPMALALWFKPLYTFLSYYVVKGGFLEGYHGYVIARLSAFSSFMRVVTAREHKS